MAEKKTPEKSRADRNEAGRPGPGRKGRALVGANVIVASLLVIALVGAANYLAGWVTDRWGATADLTRGGRYSFSDRTRRALDKVDEDIVLTSLFYAGEQNEVAQTRKRWMEDLLRGLDVRSNNIRSEFIDPAEDAKALAELGRRIAKAYEDEAESHAEVIRRFAALATGLCSLLEEEQKRFEKLPADSEETPDLYLFKQAVQQELGNRLRAVRNVLQRAREAVPSVFEEEEGAAEPRSFPEAGGLQLPDYGGTVDGIQSVADNISQVLDVIPKEAERVLEREGMKLGEAPRALLAGAAERYAGMQKELVALSERIGELGSLELETVRNRLAQDSVVVQAKGEVRVIQFEEIWPRLPNVRSRDPMDQRGFSGEQMITSALLGMTEETRPAAIFVRWGGSPISENMGSFTELAGRLKRANFLVENWDLQRNKEMPEVEGMSRPVLILMPPEPDRSRQTPPPRPGSYAPVRKFIERGGDALFFAQIRGNPMQPPTPYLGILEEMGIQVNDSAVTLFSIETPDGRTHLQGQVEVRKYPREGRESSAHPIVAPLQSMPGQFNTPCPVLESDSLPAGVEVWPLVMTPSDENYWGETNLMGLMQTREAEYDEGEDVKAPFPIAVAAVKRDLAGSEGDNDEGNGPAYDGESRVVAFGGRYFVSDQLLQGQWMFTSQGLGLVQRYPANGELVVNAMYWLAGQEDMISVGPEAVQVSRIRHIPGWLLKLIRWFLSLGMPLLALLVGIAVYFVRSRVR